MKRFWIAGVVALAMAALPGTVWAAPFTGQIDYTGSYTPDNNDLTAATQATIDAASVDISTGAFLAEGISVGDALTHASPFLFNPFGGPYAPLWSHAGTGISFDLNTLNIVFSSTNFLILEGSGVFHGAGYDDTPGDWNMTLNIVNGNLSGSFSSSSSVPHEVPEPASVVLFGLAIAGVAAAARRRQRTRLLQNS